MNLDFLIESVAENTAEAIRAEDGDYYEHGLLYCGNCHTPKQCRLEFNGKIMTPMCLCKCGTEKRNAEEAEAKRQRFIQRVALLRERGIPEKEMREWTFEADDGANEKLTKAAHNYVEKFDEFRQRGKGLLLFGTVGTGKTFYAVNIANALIDKGVSCLVTNFAKVANTLSGTFEKQDYIDKINRYSLLVIDDLSSERDTDYMNEVIFNIIDSRYRAGLPIIVTTNLTAAELKNPADIRRARTYSRLLEMCVPIEVKGQDRRKKKLNSEWEELNEMLGI